MVLLALWLTQMAPPEAGGEVVLSGASVAKKGMVVSADPRASDVGVEVLRSGGNAVDAAVATALVLAVVHPQAGNLGGGGFLVFYRARDGHATVIDSRETAPRHADRRMFLDENGEVDTKRARIGHWSVGVPGTPAGLYLAWSKYGSRPWKSLVQAAIQHARDGFAVNEDLAASIRRELQKLLLFPEAAALFAPEGRPLEVGDRLVQPELAWTLQEFAESGPLSFYEGAVAALIADEMKRAGGLVSREDLASYRAVEREPLRGSYRDLEILTVPPPSSGGIALLQILALLEPFEFRSLERTSVERIHLTVEVTSRVFADRNTFLGDPDFARLPIAGLLSDDYLDHVRRGISIDRATPSNFVRPGDPWSYMVNSVTPPAKTPEADSLEASEPVRESGSTTHFSVVDAQGNAVSYTTTLNGEFGSGLLVPGAGFFLNNEMDDFAAKPGAPNQFGLTGQDANAVAPGKRMLSSMSPTIVLQGHVPRFVLGSRGGPRIITTVLDILLDVYDHDSTLEEAVAHRRYHDQWLPDVILHEPNAFSPDRLRVLQAMGHRFQERSPDQGPWCGANCIEVTSEGLRKGVSDPRMQGAARGY